MDVNKFEADIINAIETSRSIYLTRDGNTFHGEIYADYRDEMQGELPTTLKGRGF